MLPGFPKQLFICRLRLFSPYAYDLCTHKPWATSLNHTSPLHPPTITDQPMTIATLLLLHMYIV